MSLPVSALRGSCMPTTTAPPRYELGKSWAGRGRAAGVCAAANKELQASVDPAPMKVVAPERGGVHPIFIASGAVCLAAWVFLKKPLDGWLRSDSTQVEDEATFMLARARTRQALHVQKAIGFNFSNLPARVMVELERALKENTQCRSPLMNGLYPQEELEALYRRHLENCEVPPDFAVLLQLREMLTIPPHEAKKIEREVQESGTFSI